MTVSARRQKMAAPRPYPGALFGEAAVGNECMDMRMQHERASPGVKGENECRPSAEIFRTAQQFGQRVAHRAKEDPRHRNAIE